MDLSTKTSQTLADAPNGHGADWSEDGTILFTPEGLDVLYRVPATRGTVTPVTQFHADDAFPVEATHRVVQTTGGYETVGLLYFRTATSVVLLNNVPEKINLGPIEATAHNWTEPEVMITVMPAGEVAGNFGESGYVTIDAPR